MKKSFKFNNPRKLLQIAIWSILIGIFIAVSHIESIPSKEALSIVEEPAYTTVSSFDMMDYFERKAYEQLLQNYQMRVMRTIIILCVGLFGLYQLLRDRKLELSDEGIDVYSIYSHKPYESFEWRSIEQIHIGNAKGLNGIIGDYGIYIDCLNKYDAKETTFISLKYIEEKSIVLQEIEALASTVLTVSTEVKEQSSAGGASVKTVFLQGLGTYKKAYKSLFLYSLIVFIFAFLQRFFIKTPVGLWASIANIYFAYLAIIALNYNLFKSYKEEEVTFDESWTFAKRQYKRFFGAELIKGIAIIIIVAASVLIHITSMHPLLKTTMVIATMLLGIGLYSRIYLISYIASIIDPQKSYLSVNTTFCYSYSKTIFVLTLISLLPVIIGVSIMSLMFVDLTSALESVDQLAYLALVMNFFILPFEASASMFILKNLEENSVNGEVEGLINEETA